MSKPPKLESDHPRGVEEAPTAYHDRDHAEALAALEEFRRTGVSYSVEEAEAELDRLIAERRTRDA